MITDTGWLEFGGAMLACAGIRAGWQRITGQKPGTPKEPLTDLSPGFLSLVFGDPHKAYRSEYRAVTPAGIGVTGDCCRRGHQSPAQAVAHAGRVTRRIETTGR